MAQGVVVEQVGEHLVAVVDQVDVARELGLLGVEFIAAVLRGQLGVVAVVDDGAAIEVVAHVGIDFIVEGIGEQRGAAVLETHVAAQFGNALFTVVVEHVAVDPQRVALGHAHVAEGVERTGLGIEVGTVAEHIHVAAPEPDIALEHLIVTADGLVGPEDVGILEKHLVALVAVGLGNLGGDAAHLGALGTLLGGLRRLRIGGSLGRRGPGDRSARLGATGRLRPHDRRDEQCKHTACRNDMAPTGLAVACGVMALIALVAGC